MTQDEFDLWIAYRQKNGPMNAARYYDRPAALVAYMINRANGGKAEFSDFMPKYGKEEKNAEPTLEEFLQSFPGVKIGKRG